MNAEPDFIKLYIDRISCFKKLSPMTAKVLLSMASMADEDNEVRTTKEIRKQMAESIGAEPSTVRASIEALKDAEFIYKKATGLYLLNPSFFSKKVWADVVSQRMSFELKLRYSKEHGEDVSVEAIGSTK